MCQNSADRNPKWIRRLPSQVEPRGSADSFLAHAQSGGWDGSIASAWRAGFACRDFPARRNGFPVRVRRESVAMTGERLGNLGAESTRRVQFRRISLYFPCRSAIPGSETSSRSSAPRSVPKLGRSKSEMSSETSLAAGTSRIGRILSSRPRSISDGMAQSPQFGERFRLPGFPCSSK